MNPDRMTGAFSIFVSVWPPRQRLLRLPRRKIDSYFVPIRPLSPDQAPDTPITAHPRFKINRVGLSSIAMQRKNAGSVREPAVW